MSYSALTVPYDYMAAYSSVPLRISSSDSQLYDYFKYVTNIVYSASTLSSSQNIVYGPNTYTQITFTEAHSFEIGDTILLDDTSGEYQGYYNVMSTPSSTSVVINLVLGAPLGACTCYKVIKYKMSPDIEGEAKLDLSNTLKDLVTENLSDVNDIFEGPNTRFQFDLLLGQESNYIFEFEDNGFESGYASFWNSSLPSTYTATTLPFQIGDQVVIEQYLWEWEYNDNFFYSGQLGFTGSTPHSFLTGQTVNVTGQITAPHYNGYTTVRTVVDTYAFTVWKQFNTSTPAEPGSIFGVPRPEYNTTATITDIYWDATYGVVIVTDIPFGAASQPIPGQMRLINNKKTETINDLSITGVSIYNARIDTLDYGYTTTQFDQFVVQKRGSSSNNISTILSGTSKFRIEPTTKSWLLAHTYGGLWEPRFSFYDSANNLLSVTKIDYNTTVASAININNYANNGGDLRLNLFSTHGLSVGDLIEVVDGPAYYNGFATVIQVNSSTSITVNTPYVSAGVFGAEYINIINHSSYFDYYFPVGINQITACTNTTLLSGSALSSVVDSVDYYTVELAEKNTGNTNSIYFEVNDDCSRYDILHLMWKDGKGSWLSYPFKYISEDRTEVERKDYYKSEGTWNLSNNTFGYDTFGRGQKSFFIRSRDKYVLNSGWVEEFENSLIKDLLKSVSVYLQLPDGTLIGANIINKDMQFKKKQSDYLWNYRFEVSASINENRF
jgi:hypothetical protein